ncbi:MAG: efflux RND transporter permease subunit [Dehalococcoidia bacterium]
MTESGGGRKGFYGWLGNTLERRSGWFILVIFLLTLALIFPMTMMAPEDLASDNPAEDPVVKLSDHIAETFSQEVFWTGFIVEARDGDMLTRRNLAELLQREKALKQSELADYLLVGYNEAAGVEVQGVYTVADAVNKAIIIQSGGEKDLSSTDVTDEQVKAVIEYLMAGPAAEQLIESFSALNEHSEEDGWISPALIVSVLSDDEQVLIDYLDENRALAEASLEDEAYARESYALEMQEIMRAEQVENRVWGLAIDMNHEIEEESEVGVVMLFAALSLMAVLLLAIFRSLPIMLITLAGLGMLIVWLKGLANLTGLKGSLIIDVILPVAIVVLGVDYAIQALFRYREERNRIGDPRKSLGNSTSRVGRALVLAMFTTAVAFLSNASAGIESVFGFAIAAAIAIFASFILLGLFVPAVNMRWRSWRAKGQPTVPPPVGKGFRGSLLGNIICSTGRKWKFVLPIALVVTGLAAWGWTNVETKMDAADALKSDSDFVVSLDKWDVHGADKGGEPSLLYFEGDLRQHESLEALRDTISQMNGPDEESYVGKDPITGEPNVDILLLDLLEDLIENEYSRGAVEEATGVEITDSNADFLPDTPEQLQAVYDYVVVHGLPQDEGTLRYRPAQIAERFVKLDSGDYAALMLVGVPGTREQSVVRSSAELLEEDLALAMDGVKSISKYGLTGSGNVRVAQFDAVSQALTSSLIIAVVAVLALLLIVFRSIRYAVLTIIPVLLVATWLYGFMYVGGYSLNMLTATIAAISVGVGIDFSIHFTERFREELGNGLDKGAAILKTAQNTGFALFCTALTTVLGFAVIAFAPMPMFSTFGVITAIMIALSLFMALFILPALLNAFVPESSAK